METKIIYENLKKMNEYAHSMSDFIHAPGGLTKRNLEIALDYQKKFLTIYSKIKNEELIVPYHKQLFQEAVNHYEYFSKGLKDNF